MAITPWRVKGRELANCNCDYGCPCQFNSLPTDGTCRAVVGYEIDEGHYGDVRLDGVRAAMVVSWPGAVHEGDGTLLAIVDESASEDQRQAMVRLMHGEDSEEMATMWWVYAAMSPNKLEPVYAPIDLSVDVEERVGHLRIPGLVDMSAEPIRNPVTGAVHRARIDLPHGFEYQIAEIGSASAKVTGPIPMTMESSYGQFAELHLNQSGVVR